MPPPASRTYSPERLRKVVILLTILTLPVVFGASALIYYYLRFSVMVERRLQGEQWTVSGLYARPTVLRSGLPLTADGLVKMLNSLKYDQKDDLPAGPGQFAAGNDSVIFVPRPAPGAVEEPVMVSFAEGHVKDIWATRSKRRLERHPLEPELITYLFDENREKRRVVRFRELPQQLVHAVLAIEDRRFFTHPGLDPFRIVAAAIRNYQADSYIQGGSTITQQLVKNFFLTPEKSLKRKAQEAILALVLERRVAKNEILELYLNEIYLGQLGSFSINGVGEAARMYFRKDVGNLTLTEAALLAGMIQSPNPYNPYRHPKRALERRNVVLQSMVDAGFIDPAVGEAAKKEPISVVAPSMDTADAPYFVDLVKTQLASRYDQKDLATQSLAIHTTLDLALQAAAQTALTRGLERVDKMVKRKDHPPAQGALIAIEPATGAVVALAGGRAYGSSQYNRATQARRQPGSTFKPFVYLTAFEATFDDPSLPPITPATVVEDAPAVFFYENKEYIPQNYEDSYKGYVTLRQALASSLNVATVKVAEMVTFDRVADMWNKRLGINQNVKPYPSLALGSFEATPFEMASAYNIIANGGRKVEPLTVVKVTDHLGATLEEHRRPQAQQVVHAESAFLVAYMMQSVFNGTAASARGLGWTREASGKTGTTNDMRDAWFVGFTPELLTVVWVGFDDNSPINLTGGKAALPIWVDFMKSALEGVPATPFAVPAENVVFVEIDPQTGLLSTANCPKSFPEAFIAGTEPREYCHWHSGGGYYEDQEGRTE